MESLRAGYPESLEIYEELKRPHAISVRSLLIKCVFPEPVSPDIVAVRFKMNLI